MNAPARPEVAPWKLAMTLAVAGALAGLLLVFVDQVTRPKIEAHRRATLKDAVKEVLAIDPDAGDGSRIVSVRVDDAGLELEPEAQYEVDASTIDRVFLGYDASGAVRGFAIVHQQMGFQDVIRLIFGYDPRTETVLAMRVLESRETPGLGDKIEKDAAWVAMFDDVKAPIVAVKSGERSAPDEVDTITGATISAKGVIDIVNAALARQELAKRLAQWLQEAGQ
ncbi:MAG: FMN-binding protein [Planctomycetota bacterium]|nr:FMN-binding protein [Planctomycetota bacterium]